MTGRWTTEEMASLDGAVAVVTGANSGIGFQTAVALAAHGAHVVMACRDQERGAGAVERIRALVPSADLTLGDLDLADLGRIRRFAAGFGAEHTGLDILINNAGVMAIPRMETADGFEMQFGTNHLGHFALTAALLDHLLARPGARVVTVSSIAARIGRIDFHDLQGLRRYDKWGAYGRAKLANQLFAFELARRAAAAGADLLSLAAHPGYAATNLQATGPRLAGQAFRRRLFEMGNTLVGQSAAAGALPNLYAATASGLIGGEYIGPDRLFGTRGHPRVVTPVTGATDLAVAKRLWEVSEELTGASFGRLDGS